MKKELFLSVWAVAMVSILSLILTRELGATMIVILLAVPPILFYFDYKDRLLKIRWLENSLVLSLFFSSVYGWSAAKRSFLLAVAEFLAGFLLTKLAFKKDRNDSLQIIILSFFNLLSAATLASDFSFMVPFVLFMVSAAVSLCYYTLSEEIPSPLSSPSANSSAENRVMLRWILRHGLLTEFLAVTFAVFIFIFFPRLSVSVFQGAFLNPVHTSGFSEKIVLSKSGKIHEDPTVAMRVEFPLSAKFRIRKWYLRGETLSLFDGRGWSRSRNASLEKTRNAFRSILPKKLFLVQSLNQDALRRDFSFNLGPEYYMRQKIYMEAMDTPLLFASPWALNITAALPQLSVFQDGSAARPVNYTGRISYEAVSFLERPGEKVFLKSPSRGNGYVSANVSAETPEEDDRQYLQLPDTDFGRIRSLISKIVSNKDSPYLKAKKIEMYLKRNYAYSLDLNARSSSNPLEWFLFGSRAGQCEYFASAMAVMLRLEGIPARIATGFLAYEWNPDGNYFIVRYKDAHSWVESLIDGLWVDFDPSPRIPEVETEQSTLIGTLRQKLDYLNFLWNSKIMSYDADSQKEAARKIELKSNALSAKFEKNWGEYPLIFKKTRLAIKKLIVLAPILTILFALVIHVKKLKKYFKKMKPKEINSTWKFYHEMISILSKRGVSKNDCETPYEFLMRIINENLMPTKGGIQEVRFLTNLYYKLRFSTASADPFELTQVNISLKHLKALIKK